jgi:hypothetical protein
MTAKRKITDKNGVQVFPITHTKAVVDDNGSSVEERLQENLDLINQKQLEIGAVPSDVAPTAGSSNWVTSGGVYAFTTSERTVIDDFSSAEIKYYLPARVHLDVSDKNTLTYTATTAGARVFITFPQELKDGEKYNIIFDFEKTASGNIPLLFTHDMSSATIFSISLSGANGHVDVDYIHDLSVLGFYVASSNIGANGTLILRNLRIVKVITVKDLDKSDEENENRIESVDKSLLELSSEFDKEKEYLPYKVNLYKQGINWCSYAGPSIKQCNRIGFELHDSCGGSQGCAICNDTMFILSGQGKFFSWVNLITKEGRRTLDCPFLGSDSNVGWHCNSAQFSNQFYDEEDEFPLLYISGSEGEKATMFLVARIIRFNDKYTFHMQLVQTVTMPPSVTYANIGVEDGCLYMQGSNANGLCNVYKCEIPPIYDEEDNLLSNYSMSDDDIIRIYSNVNAPANPQGVCAYRGILYSTWGNTLGSSTYLTALDLYSGENINSVYLSPMGFNFEPEGLGFLENTMFVSFSRGIYRFWI